MKRLIDIAVSGVGLVALAPIFLVLGILTRISLGSPIFFSQSRPGLYGKPFTIYKFRTMNDRRNELGELLPDNVRLTSFGRFLRGSSMDELPELWNVLRGDMSLVGPRPLLMDYLPLYTCDQARRNEVRPGITGWAQINGRNALTWEEKFALDIWYVDNRSNWLDIKILLMTVKQVLRRDGISAPGEATMPKFLGTSIDKNR